MFANDSAARPSRIDRMAVIGVGQMGGSFALGLKSAGLVGEVVGTSRQPATVARALELGLIDRGAPSACEACAGADLIVLATPVQSLGPLAAEIAPSLASGAIVTDVGSVKAPAIAAVEHRLPAGVAFVGCHPIAGTERSGPGSATAALFRGRKCVICPGDRATPAAIQQLEALWRAVGAIPVRMEAGLHDRVLAAGSHLPHVAAYALASVLSPLSDDIVAAIVDMAPTSLRDTTRIAASSPAMWRDIFLDNSQAVLPLMDELLARTARLRAAIASGDSRALDDFLGEARDARRRAMGSTDTPSEKT